MRLRRLLTTTAALAIALGTAACASDDASDEPDASTPAPSQSVDTGDAAEPTPSATSSDASASEAPASEPVDDGPAPVPAPAAYEPPEGEPAGLLARADHAVVDGVPTSSSTAVGGLVSGQTFVVEGQCTGGGASVDFRVDRAIDAPPEQRLLLEGTLACDAAASQGYALSAPYDGPVQLTIAAGDDVTQAWAVVLAQ